MIQTQRQFRKLMFKFFLFLALLSTGIQMLEAKAQDTNAMYGDNPKVSIQAVTSVFAPLQFEENGELSGYTVDIVEKIFENLKKSNANFTYSMNIVPWKRAIKTTLSNPNLLLFSLSRTPAREEQYHWIGEISPYEIYFYKLKKNTAIQVDSIEQFKQLGYTMGVTLGGNSENYAIEQGLVLGESYTTYNDYRHGLRMLLNGRFDLIPLTELFARTNACQSGVDSDKLKRVFRNDHLSSPLWLVLSKGTSEAVVAQFRAEFSKLEKDGFIKETQKRYLDLWEKRPCVPIREFNNYPFKIKNTGSELS